jgi:hypothetical protein
MKHRYFFTIFLIGSVLIALVNTTVTTITSSAVQSSICNCNGGYL